MKNIKNYKTITISIIVGFIAGSLIGVWPWKNEDINGNLSLFIPDFSISQIIQFTKHLFQRIKVGSV